MAVTLVCGDDAYLERREVEKLLEGGETARFPSFTRETIASLSASSFFGPPKVLVIADGIPGVDVAPFWEYLAAPNPDATLVIWIRSIDRRLKGWSRIREEKGLVVKWIKKASLHAAAGFLHAMASQRGCEMEEKLAERAVVLSGYESDPEVDFYFLGNAMTALTDAMEDGRRKAMDEDVSRYFGRDIPVDRFGASRRLTDGDVSLLRDVKGICRDCGGAVPFLMLLARDFRVAYKAKHLSEAEIGVRKTPLSSWKTERILKGLMVTMEAVREIKEGEVPDETATVPCIWKLLQLRKEGNADGRGV